MPLANTVGVVSKVGNHVEGIDEPDLQRSVVEYHCESADESFVFEVDYDRGAWAFCPGTEGEMRGWLADTPIYTENSTGYASVMHDCRLKTEGKLRQQFMFVYFIQTGRFVLDPYA
jgi:hypothetical protein